MASPFPGIDPYLESQGYWPDFHASLILYCRDALNDVLPDYAFISRGNRRPNCDVFAWSVRQALPRIPIPLRAPDNEVSLDLPALFVVGYERGRYARALDYSAPLELPLAPADRAWAEEVAGTKTA
jgi:hypothetical protein